jgi:hypothetical protein
MKSKIPCTAQTLEQLEPGMLQAVVEARAYKLGHQYVGENRVRIVQADDSEISATVLGNTGMHEQRIRLKGGTLMMKCTCNADEQPFCRHCCAVLLQYHHNLQKMHGNGEAPQAAERVLEAEIVEPAATTSAAPPPPPPRSEAMAMGLGGQLREVMIFMDWLQPAVHAMEQGQPLPDTRSLGSGEAFRWGEAMRSLEGRASRDSDKIASLEADLAARDGQIVRLMQEAERTTQEVKAAHATCESLRQELSGAKQTIVRLSEAENERTRLQRDLRSMMDRMQAQGAELEQASGKIKDISQMLKSLRP